MMRLILFVLILTLSFSTVAIGCSDTMENVNVKVYFVDAGIMKLMSHSTSVLKSTPEHQAKCVINELIKGKDENTKIRRLIPDIKRCMSVRVNGKTAYVNIKEKMISSHPDGRELELLTVYQIVNSLTSIEGIENVRFSINGRVQKNFMGYLDMREIFTSDLTV